MKIEKFTCRATGYQGSWKFCSVVETTDQNYKATARRSPGLLALHYSTTTSSRSSGSQERKDSQTVI